MKVELELAFAQGHWELDAHSGNWIVQSPKGGLLWEFPSGFDEKKVMSAIRLGRKYELRAFNVGIAFGKEKSAETSKTLLAAKDAEIRSLMAMNEQLSEQLEKAIG